MHGGDMIQGMARLGLACSLAFLGSSASSIRDRFRLQEVPAPVSDGAPQSYCDSTRIQAQVALYTATGERGRQCPTDWWVKEYAALYPGGLKTAYDIGCNKGFVSMGFMEHLLPEIGLDEGCLMHAYDDMGIKFKCSGCGCPPPSSPNPQSTGRPASRLVVHCFEPSEIHIGDLQAGRGRLLDHGGHRRGPYQVKWEIHHMAVADKPGTAEFPAECNTALCGLSLTGATGSTTTVNVTSVDFHMVHHFENYIDILKVDTEGYDSAVIDGASVALRAHKIGVLQFEYNTMGLWKQEDMSLKPVIDKLEEWGYTCFMEGSPTLTRLTGCWDPLYDVKRWTNVVCAVSGSPMCDVLDASSFLAQLAGKGT